MAATSAGWGMAASSTAGKWWSWTVEWPGGPHEVDVPAQQIAAVIERPRTARGQRAATAGISTARQ